MSEQTCPSITWSELKSSLFGHRTPKVIDVREVHEYREGHIEGSILIPLGTLPQRAVELHKDEDLIVVCRSGNRSREACEILRGQGFRSVRSLTGGLSSWTA